MLTASCLGHCASHTAAASSAGWQDTADGSWLAALAAARVPLRRLRLCDGSIVPGDTVLYYACHAGCAAVAMPIHHATVSCRLCRITALAADNFVKCRVSLSKLHTLR